MKQPKGKHVIKVLKKLQKKKQDITSLTIKNGLRHKGFYATQESVNGFIKMLLNNKQLVIKSYGEYRTYKYVTAPDMSDDENEVKSYGVKLENKQSHVIYTRRDGEPIIGYIAGTHDYPDIPLWIVSSEHTKQKMFVPRAHTKDMARQIFAYAFGIKFKKTKARKVK